VSNAATNGEWLLKDQVEGSLTANQALTYSLYNCTEVQKKKVKIDNSY